MVEGFHTKETILQGLESGNLQMWAAHNSFCLTELRLAPTGLKALHLFLAGANPGTDGLDELKGLYPLIEGWGKEEGCTRVTMVGRRGWAKTFLTRTEGFVPSLTYYEKELV